LDIKKLKVPSATKTLTDALERNALRTTAVERALQTPRVLDQIKASQGIFGAAYGLGGFDAYSSGLSSVRAISEGIYGPLSSFTALSEAVRKIQEPYTTLGESLAEAVSRFQVRPFDIPTVSITGSALGGISGLEAYQSTLSEISRSITKALEVSRPTLAFSRDWDASITTRLKLFETAWSQADTDLSVFEFGRLSRFSDLVHGPEPYAPAVIEFIDDELDEGDGELEGNGFEIFEDAAIPTITLAAGFVFEVPRVPIPALEDGSDFDGVFDPAHHSILADLEQRLRTIIVEALTLYDGGDWTRKVPAPIVEKWRVKQEADRAVGAPVFGLIHYSDFGELADIIIGRGNWNNAFSAIFQGQQDIAVSLRRLSPIRNSVAHARPLSKLQALWLLSEATRLYIQLGVPNVQIVR